MNLDNFEKGQGIYLCCHNYRCYNSMVGNGGKAAMGGCMGVVIKEYHYVPPVLEWKMMMMTVIVMSDMTCHFRTFVHLMG